MHSFQTLTKKKKGDENKSFHKPSPSLMTSYIIHTVSSWISRVQHKTNPWKNKGAANGVGWDKRQSRSTVTARLMKNLKRGNSEVEDDWRGASESMYLQTEWNTDSFTSFSRGIFLSKKRGDWDPTLFMGICSLMASKHCSLDRDTVRLPDHSQAHTRRIA